MTETYDPIQPLVFWTIILAWFVFAGAFLLRKKSQPAPRRTERNVSMYGILLVAVGYAAVWSIRRPFHAPLTPFGAPVGYILDALAVGIAVSSAWITLAAVRTLGKQWNVKAVLVEDHTLITTGPYGLVRHPIYLGMVGMLVATGMASSEWYVLLPATAAAIAGTAVRIHFEEKLLAGAFGAQFESYRRSVQALIPGIY